jgi:hypothetical protein
MCRRYARVTTARNPTMIAVMAVAQIRKRQPISNSRPSTISTNGNVCATTSDAAGEIILYDSTCSAKLEIFIETENLRTNIGQRCVLGIKSLENPAYTKIPPRTKRPIQMIARRAFRGLDSIMMLASGAKFRYFWLSS